MIESIYYIKDIPNILSVTQFNHALAIANHDSTSALLIHEPPPAEIDEAYEYVRVIRSRTPIGRIYDALELINTIVEQNSSVILITAGQIEPVVAGRMSNADWVVDLYDDPLQGIRNNPISRHQITDRVLRHLVAGAPFGSNTLHQNAPNKAGVKKVYCINGAPTDLIEHRRIEYSSPLRAVIAGKVTLDKGMDLIIDGVSRSNASIVIDAFGAVNDKTLQYCDSVGVSNQIRFHGKSCHEKVRRAITDSHIGLCVLPKRGDWMYHYPIKLGEYLAGGTIPLASDFPAFIQLAGESGIYVEPSPKGVAGGLEEIEALSQMDYQKRLDAVIARGEDVNWSSVRERFAETVLEDPEV
jgi:hypothetical protein